MGKKILIALVLMFLLYGFLVEPNKLKVTKYEIENSALKGIKAVFVGDFHVRPNDFARLKKIAETIRAQDADLILSAGGYLKNDNESSSMPIEKIAEILSTANTKNRFYTVLSEQDASPEYKNKTVSALNRASIIVLLNANRRVVVKNKVIFIAGFEGNHEKAELERTLRSLSGNIILLSHSPSIFENVPSKVSLTLAGHTHGGQIRLPFYGGLFPPKDVDRKISYGLIEENNKKMIVTSGLGTSGASFRINCQPEIVVIEFK